MGLDPRSFVLKCLCSVCWPLTTNARTHARTPARRRTDSTPARWAAYVWKRSVGFLPKFTVDFCSQLRPYLHPAQHHPPRPPYVAAFLNALTIGPPPSLVE